MRGLDSQTSFFGLQPEGFEVLSLHDPKAMRAEVPAIFGGIQLPAKPDVPSPVAAERWECHGESFEQGEVVRSAEVRNTQCEATNCEELLAGEPDRIGGVAVFAIASRQTVELFGVSHTKPGSNVAGRRAGTGHERQESKTPVNREERVSVVQTDQCRKG